MALFFVHRSRQWHRHRDAPPFTSRSTQCNHYSRNFRTAAKFAASRSRRNIGLEPVRPAQPSARRCGPTRTGKNVRLLHRQNLCSEALELWRGLRSFRIPCAGVAELADALDSKSSDRKIVWVRAPPPAQFVGVGWLNAARSMAGSASLFACSRQTTRDASTSLGMTTSLDRVGTSSHRQSTLQVASGLRANLIAQMR